MTPHYDKAKKIADVLEDFVCAIFWRENAKFHDNAEKAAHNATAAAESKQEVVEFLANLLQ